MNSTRGEGMIEYENDLTRHLILFSKGHYQCTNNIMDDLKRLMTNRAGLPENYIRDVDVYSFVSECFVDSCTKSDIKTVLKCFYHKPFFIGEGQATLAEMVSHMIGMMACIQVFETEGDTKIELVKLGKPDPRYLPVPKPNEKSHIGSTQSGKERGK